jgi:hypothetical protein
MFQILMSKLVVGGLLLVFFFAIERCGRLNSTSCVILYLGCPVTQFSMNIWCVLEFPDHLFLVS